VAERRGYRLRQCSAIHPEHADPRSVPSNMCGSRIASSARPASYRAARFRVPAAGSSRLTSNHRAPTRSVACAVGRTTPFSSATPTIVAARMGTASVSIEQHSSLAWRRIRNGRRASAESSRTDRSVESLGCASVREYTPKDSVQRTLAHGVGSGRRAVRAAQS